MTEAESLKKVAGWSCLAFGLSVTISDIIGGFVNDVLHIHLLCALVWMLALEQLTDFRAVAKLLTIFMVIIFVLGVVTVGDGHCIYIFPGEATGLYARVLRIGIGAFFAAWAAVNAVLQWKVWGLQTARSGN